LAWCAKNISFASAALENKFSFKQLKKVSLVKSLRERSKFKKKRKKQKLIQSKFQNIYESNFEIEKKYCI